MVKNLRLNVAGILEGGFLEFLARDVIKSAIKVKFACVNCVLRIYYENEHG